MAAKRIVAKHMGTGGRPQRLFASCDRGEVEARAAAAEDDRRHHHMQAVEAVRLEKARDRSGAALDQDAPQAARGEAREDGGRRDLAVLDRQRDLFDAGERTGAVPGDDEARYAVVAQCPRAGRQPPVRIDDDADGMRAADPAHRQQGIVRDGGPDPDDDGIDQRAEPVEMVEPFAAIDVVGMPGHRCGTAVERLADLPDHHEIVHQPGAQRPENALPPRRRMAQPGPDGSERIAPAGVVLGGRDGLDQAHGIPRERPSW